MERTVAGSSIAKYVNMAYIGTLKSDECVNI